MRMLHVVELENVWNPVHVDEGGIIGASEPTRIAAEPTIISVTCIEVDKHGKGRESRNNHYVIHVDTDIWRTCEE